MKNLNYNFAVHVPDIIAGLEELEPNVIEEVQNTDPGQALLKKIYSLGSDGFPVGDLAYFVGKNSNPDVQRFILDNLMQDVSSQANVASMDLTDDQITLFTRKSGESVQDYASRLNESIAKDKFILDYAKSIVSKKTTSQSEDVK